MNKLIGTKADILNELSGLVMSACLPKSYVFTRKEWANQKIKNSFLRNIQKDIPFIIRSSSKSEDTNTASNAGAYLSVPNVFVDSIDLAVKDVFSSYSENHLEDQVLIQTMITDIIRSGVGFSYEPSTGSPYIIINWQDGSDSSYVTNGKGGKVWVQAATELENIKTPSKLKQVITLLTELKIIYGDIPLDIEFAISRTNSEETLWLLQVRKLIITKNIDSMDNQKIRLGLIEKNINDNRVCHPSILGDKTIYGIMPDWNPAEIIGIRPKPLALSLYKELITDKIWAKQRKNYGYRDLRGFPLMKSFLGLPYIDLRLSFNSFIPANINDKLAKKLVEFYIDELSRKKYLHDKIEFSIAFTCYDFNLKNRLEKLKRFGFKESECQEISDSLLKLTTEIVDSKNGKWLHDIRRIKELEIRRESLQKLNISDSQKLFCLIEDTKKFGTLPFAGLARTAFIAVSLLRSLVDIEVFSESDYNIFIRSISTIGSNLFEDKIKLSKVDFLKKYGHLRPGTYDILSPRYDEEPNLYFDWNKNECLKTNFEEFKLEKAKLLELEKVLNKHNINLNSKDFLFFISEAIKKRELSKFIFTKNLSDILFLINKIGNKMDFTDIELSFSNINVFKKLSCDANNAENLIKESIKQGKNEYKTASYINLPPLIIDSKDVWGFEVPETSPNFITQASITAPVKLLKNNSSDIKGFIICIPFADPGYDWIFAYNIKGLITCYGGLNSHMAIRTGEMGIPAVIGCGESKFRKWSKSKVLQINCENKEVLIIS